MRKPKVENKYNLKPKDIENAIVLDEKRLHQQPFWRNNSMRAWCLSENTCKNEKDMEYGTYDEYWIGFYDNGDIKLKCYSYGGMCSYNFEEFYNTNEIDYEMDLHIQEKLLKRVNWLIDEKIIKIPKKERE